MKLQNHTTIKNFEVSTDNLNTAFNISFKTMYHSKNLNTNNLNTNDNLNTINAKLEDLDFTSHVSTYTCKNGCVASSSEIASQVGVDILKAGGNAADCAVAVAAALNVVEPCSTGS